MRLWRCLRQGNMSKSCIATLNTGIDHPGASLLTHDLREK